MIDLHAHIIPGFDDGAQTIEDALDMARTAISSGVRIMTATSHGDFSSCNPQIMIQKYRRGLSALRSAIRRAGLPLRVASGMELLVNESLLHYAEKYPLPSLNGSGYLLVEFYFDIRYREAVRMLEVLRKMGYRLVLAHPERYDFTKQDVSRAAELADSGIILQINKGSLLREFGERSHRAAEWILSRGLAGVVASDAHDPVLRTPDLAEVADVLAMDYGAEAAEVLLKKRPAEILKGK